jgi:hypothetical protein
MMNLMKIKQVEKNLEGMEGEYKNIGDDIREAFEDYEYCNESSVLINKLNPDGTILNAYVDHKDAPGFKLFVKKNNNEYLINKVEIIY